MTGGQNDSDVPGLRARLAHAIGESRVSSGLDAAEDSTVLSWCRSAGERTAELTRHSALYRWLTREPEPAVVVIDLRETYTVGPVIAVLDRLLSWLAPYWRASAVKRGVDRLESFAERTADTRAGQLLVRVLEPPAPPDADARDEDDSD